MLFSSKLFSAQIYKSLAILCAGILILQCTPGTGKRGGPPSAPVAGAEHATTKSAKQNKTDKSVSKAEAVKVVTGFMNTMKEAKADQLVNFLSEGYLMEQNIVTRQINYFIVTKYEITKVNKGLVTVDIDHGQERFCSRIWIQTEREPDERVLIKPAGVENNYVMPWTKHENLCE